MRNEEMKDRGLAAIIKACENAALLFYFIVDPRLPLQSTILK